MSPKIRRSFFAAVSVFVILACSFPSIVPSVDPSAASTSAALTIAAAIRQLTTPSPIASPFPTLTPALPPEVTFSPTSTLSPLPGFTATPSVPMMSVSVDTNCRVGPGKAYEIVGAILVGETSEVIAKDPTGNYWYIRNPDKPGGFCWAWGEYATIVGNTTFLPVYTPPPTPTAAPDFEVKYSNMDSCVGWWVEFTIKNVGAMPFESISMTVKDTVTSVSLSSVYNEFTNIKGCVSSTSIDSLEPGDSTVVSSPAFSYNPDGNKMKATINLCTGDGLTGICVSQTISFKP